MADRSRLLDAGWLSALVVRRRRLHSWRSSRAHCGRAHSGLDRETTGL